MFLLSLVTLPGSRLVHDSIPADSEMSGLPSVKWTLNITASYVWDILWLLFFNAFLFIFQHVNRVLMYLFGFFCVSTEVGKIVKVSLGSPQFYPCTQDYHVTSGGCILLSLYFKTGCVPPHSQFWLPTRIWDCLILQKCLPNISQWQSCIYRTMFFCIRVPLHNKTP